MQNWLWVSCSVGGGGALKLTALRPWYDYQRGYREVQDKSWVMDEKDR